MPNKDRILSASEAILEATDQMMKKDNNLILIGEGINDPKGIFGTTINLSKKYGEKRAIESPISENGITGIAIGLGINNFKVLLIHQRVEFALLSIEQIFNNAAKSFYATNVLAAVITSSPLPISKAFKDNLIASVPEFTPIAYFDPINLANLFSN